MRRGKALWWLATAVAIVAAGIGVGCCTPVGYYAGEALDGARLLTARRPIDRVLAKPGTPEELRAKLEIAVTARDYAIDRLGLPDNGSYRHYVELGRPHASWIVTAAPELSLVPIEWCFPIAGCVTYRGYFSPRRAERFAARLRRRGSDVDVSGVDAFSTLGRLPDPVLSSFLDRSPAALAGLLFHELAHQRLYVKGDTRFNESFATLVELEGVGRWLRDSGRGSEVEVFESGKRRQREWIELLSGYRARLAELYAGGRPIEAKRAEKRRLFGELVVAIGELRGTWGWDPDAADADGEHQEWNNADLVSVEAYWDLVPAFRALLAEAGDDLEAFYRAAEEIAELAPEARAERLATLAGSQ